MQIPPEYVGIFGGALAGLALLVREIRLARQHSRDAQEKRIDSLFIEIGKLNARIDDLSDHNAELGATNARLKAELSSVTSQRDDALAHVAELEAQLGGRRKSD